MVTADHAIEGHDIGIGKRAGDGDEVAVHEARPCIMAATGRLLARDLEVGGRRVHVHGASHAPVEQLVVNRADAGADVEQQCVAGVEGLERRPKILDEQSGRLVWPAPAVTPQRAPRRLRIELLLDALTLRTRHPLFLSLRARRVCYTSLDLLTLSL